MMYSWSPVDHEDTSQITRICELMYVEDGRQRFPPSVCVRTHEQLHSGPLLSSIQAPLLVVTNETVRFHKCNELGVD